jgi:PAS domain S-box-containing protein
VSAYQRSSDTGLISELQGILKNTGVGVWSFDGARREFILDDVCRELFDIGPGDELNPALLQSRLHPEDIASYWRATREAESTGEHAVDYRIVRRDGSVRFVSSRGRVKPRAPGEAPVVNGVLIDLTQRKSLEVQLREAELRAQHLAEAMPGLFMYVDSDFTVRFVNNRSAELSGGPGWQMLDRPLPDVIGRERFEARRAMYERVLAGSIVTIEMPQTSRSGVTRWYSMTYQPDADATGRVRGFMALGIDVTDRREALQALEARTQELARSKV